MMKLNTGFFWLIFLLGVGNLWIVDGYKCEFQFPFSIKYVCEVVSDSSENKENHISGKTDDDYIKVVFDSNLYTISHFTQSESTLFCQRFKNMEIEIKGYKLKSIDANSFQNCEDVKKIDISSTSIRELPENLFSKNLKLTELCLYANELKTLPENIFASQTELKSLWLSDYFFTFLPLDIFKPLTKLQKLTLENTNLKINPNWFKSLKNLNHLDLTENNISDLPKNMFSSLESLEELNLRFNKLTVIHADSFGTLPRLRMIKLSYNNINGIDEKLINNTNITEIDMRKNVCCQDRTQDNYDHWLEISNHKSNIREVLKTCFQNYESTYKFRCGRPKIMSNETIHNGEGVKYGQFPW